jgi:hypothetical protein
MDYSSILPMASYLTAEDYLTEREKEGAVFLCKVGVGA